MSWSSLPENALQQIFQYSEVFDVEKCLLVCKNWYHEADFYLKDKVRFITGTEHYTGELRSSKRRFQSVVIDCRGAEAIYDLKAIPNSKLLEAKIIYDDITNLSEVIKMIGSKIKSLELVNDEPDKTGYKGDVDLECTPSVENLSIMNYRGRSVKNAIPKMFSNLKSLKLFRVSCTQKLIQAFCTRNPSLETLIISNVLAPRYQDDLLAEIIQLKKLKSLHLCQLRRRKNCEDIVRNFENLETLEIEMLEEDTNDAQKLFRHPRVSHISLRNCVSSRRFWEEVFSNMTNFVVTHLVLENITIDDGDITACIAAFPNICSFTLSSPDSIRAHVFQEMSKNWLNLEYLSIKTGIKKDDSRRELCYFEKLAVLVLNFDEVAKLLDTVDIKADNLTVLYLNGAPPESTWLNRLFRTQKTLKSICSYFPYLKKLRFLGGIRSFPGLETSGTGKLETNMFLKEISKIENNNLRIVFEKKVVLNHNDVLEEFCQQSGAVVEFKKDIVRRILLKGKEIFWMNK